MKEMYIIFLTRLMFLRILLFGLCDEVLDAVAV